MTRLLSLLLFFSTLSATASAGWQKDILGNGYEMRHVAQPADYSGAVRSSIVRLKTPIKSKRGVLYIHGFNDYFFQAAMGKQFVCHGYNFYAVDLRKYGRSLMAGQKRCQVRSMREYFPDIDSAIVQMQADGISEIVLMGHSTGGLTAAYYQMFSPRPAVKALVLNSPFLDWNLGKLEPLVPAIAAVGALFPEIPIPQGNSTAYSESLLKGQHGEWQYNTSWKSEGSTPVDAGWVRAIDNAQKQLREGPKIKIPILLLYSGMSVNAESWTPECNQADAVLDVADIRRYGSQLGTHVTCAQVNGGLHDLFLSSKAVRSKLYPFLFHWLGTVPTLR